MALSGFPFNHSTAGAVGAGTGVAIPVSGLKTGNVLLAVIKYGATGAPTGLDPAAFAVSNGSIQSATVSTSGFMLCVVWAT